MSVAAQKIGINRSTLWKWLQNDDELRQAINDIEEEKLDFTESQLTKLIKSGNPAAIFFHLKCKGKNRGYVERQEIASTEDSPLITTIQRVIIDEK